MDAITSWYQQLTTREQRIVAISLPLAVLIIGLMLIQHTQREKAVAEQRYEQALRDYKWLRSDTAAFQTWQKTFGKRSLGKMEQAEELGSLLNDGLKKFRLRGTVNPAGENWRVSINSSDGNRTLSFIEAAVGSGAVPEQISLERNDSRGNVTGQLVFKALLR